MERYVASPLMMVWWGMGVAARGVSAVGWGMGVGVVSACVTGVVGG